MKKIKISLLITFFMLEFLTGCTNKSNDSVITEVRIAYFPNITHAQALVTKGLGMLEQKLGDDIKIKWISFNAGPSEIEALFAGEIDIGYIGPVPAVNGYVQSNGDIKIIAGASNGGSVLVARSDVDIRAAADLDGKTVAVPQFGNTQHLSLLSLLSANSLDSKANGGSVNIVQSSNADIANLMDMKNIDAALVPEPWGSILELNHNAKVVLDYDEIDINGIPSTAVVIARKEFIDKHGDIVKKFIEAHIEATEYINNGDALEIINDQIFEITQSRIEDSVLNNAYKRLDIIFQIPEFSIMSFAETGISEQFITKMPNTEIFDGSFLK